MKLSRGKTASILIFLIVLIDQIVKIWIKTHMEIGESIQITSWFHIYFTENPGMAFGMEIFGKLYLTIFRIIAVGVIGYYLYHIIRHKYKVGFIASIASIFAGAIGNIIDSVFYGVLFGSSAKRVAEFMPQDGGYAPLFHGRVVDMFYFPLIQGHFPSWVPFWGGEEFIFFRPIFNVADSAISIGVFVLLFFYGRYLLREQHKGKPIEGK